MELTVWHAVPVLVKVNTETGEVTEVSVWDEGVEVKGGFANTAAVEFSDPLKAMTTVPADEAAKALAIVNDPDVEWPGWGHE